MNDDAKSIIAKFEKMKGKRQLWDNLNQDIATYVSPMRDNILIWESPGTKMHNDLLDSTAVNSAELLAATLHSMLTNPVGYFFNLTSGNLELDSQDGVRKYFQEVIRTIHDTLANTNFQTEVHEYFLDLVTFGIGNVLAEADDETLIRFSSRGVKEVFLDQNRFGVIDQSMRLMMYSPKDLVEDFGLDELPMDIQKEYKEGVEREYEVIHAVYPKAHKEKFNFAFKSKYVLVAKKKIMREGGFRQNPLISARFSKKSGEIYGRGPGEKGLPEARLVNLMQETTIRSAQKVIDPPMQAPDDGFVFPLITKPGGINFYRAGSQDRIEPIFNQQRIDYGMQLTELAQGKIREAFYIDQLKLREGPQMTATEVMERTEQAMRFLGPMLARQEVEFLQPLVTRIYDILEKKEKIPKLPEEIKAYIEKTGQPIKVKFSSVMAMSQRQSEVQNIQRTMQTASTFISADPSALDNFDNDAAVRYIGKLFNFPQELIRDKEAVQGIRKQRAQAEQAAQQAEQQAMQADSASKLVKAVK